MCWVVVFLPYRFCSLNFLQAYTLSVSLLLSVNVLHRKGFKNRKRRPVSEQTGRTGEGEGQADSFKACWCSAVGRANAFRS